MTSAPPPPRPRPAPPPRLVAIWVPDWPVVALTLEARAQRRTAASRQDRLLPDPALEPVAVVSGHEVLAASAPARAAGLAAGMPLRTARSLCPGLTVMPTQPQREARSFEAVMEALDAHLPAPLVARPGLAVSGARGPARWAGGEGELAARLVESLARDADVECQVGIADSLAGAVLAARQGTIIPPGATPGFLAPRPLSAALACLTTRRLRQEAIGLLEILARLGLRTLGDLAALPLKEVAARFGPAGARLHRLASGTDHQVPRSPRPAKDICASIDLDPPAERADTAAFAARSLAEGLSDRLVAAGLAAGRLRVEARCQDGGELTRLWLLETTPSAVELTDRVRWQLDGWLAGRSGRPPAAPLTRLSLTALELSAAGASQAGLWQAPDQQAAVRATRAAHRVESLLGAGAVRIPLLVAGRDPRSRVRLTPWGEQPGSGPGAAQEAGSAETAPWADALPSPSPSVVLARPRPALLLDERGRELGVDLHGQLDGDPSTIRIEDGRGRAGEADGWHHRDGAELRVLSWAGPWPMDEGWWTPDGANRRAYLQVTADPGPPLLLVRSGRWWIEAVYD
ncbi:DNA polymerase Y family protein [Actinomyces bowdenii]|uniref:Y-family DNA polymerase n=1 Tax=Actinomyces bowdenii TaxID=131109 RepID=UPI001ABC102E|nr:DNA polymerase Y family protein [Actinomyces bowdenii]MBO3725215.1 DNA polymerase Y family protein [Actinomyces bowdenii]